MGVPGNEHANPCVKRSTNWCGERMSKLSFDGFNSSLPEGPAESSVHSPEWACICLSFTQYYMTNSNMCSQFPVFFFKETGRPVVPQQDLHLMEPPLSTLQGATALSLRTWDLLTLKNADSLKHQSAAKSSCYLFPPLWFFLRLDWIH